VTRDNSHPLPNLSLLRRLLATGTLLVGVVLFFAGWIVAVLLAEYEFTLSGLWTLGEILVVFEEQSMKTFMGVFIAHALSLPMIIGVTDSLFRRLPLPRGTRIALTVGPAALAALDLVMWAVIPLSPLSQHLLGPVMVMVSLVYAAKALWSLKHMWFFTRWRNPPAEPQRVVIVGGGFSGLYCAMGLDGKLGWNEHVQITVVDQRNYFLFPPLLPSVAAGAIETRQVTTPFRRIFEATNVAFRKESVARIDLEERVLHTCVATNRDPETGALVQTLSTVPYDYLVLSPGAVTNTFGVPGVEEHAFFMSELADAVQVRNHVIDCFELAARETDLAVRRELLRFVIVGGGPTGVELASELQDLAHHVLLKRYPEIEEAEVEVCLVQSGDRVLPGWHSMVADRSKSQLSTMGVRLLLGTRTVAVSPTTATLKTGEVLATRTVCWCTGVKPATMLAGSDLPLDRGGRVLVDGDLRVQGQDRAFCLGDAASLEDPATGRPYPPLGQVAFQQGGQCATNLVRLLKGRETKPFRYFNFGSLVSVGEHFAVVDLLGMRFSGFVAWVVWRTLYLTKLVGFGNKVRVVLDWTLDLLLERSISQLQTRRDPGVVLEAVRED
jgi:NADH:ubiquinone reductase (H+-translocating)